MFHSELQLNQLYNYKFHTNTLNSQPVNVYLIAIHRKVINSKNLRELTTNK
jgi:hypothetical protein